ncbi:Cyclin-like F-box [Beauveria brongniartii RCEF 3172]|uniref:Cyclin-like F-box n=1 Tax=Beauveria brongniartii RCEF 3172 TaxID=1081107 RepID=A0A162IXC9_9HYPO|nr:Cyclin-like F-box [Beauveria brongniartii RCEF 3172]
MVHTKAIARVPDEILVMIFSQLLKPDLRISMLVCKQWANNTVGLLWGCARFKDSRLVWRTLASPEPFFDYRSMVKFVCLNSNVTDDEVLFDAKFRIMALRLFNCRLTETGFAPIVQDISSLLLLDIFAEHGNAGTYIRTIADRCTALQNLRICCCKASLSTLSKSCKSLRELLDEDVLALSENCENIIEIKLDTCEKITSASVAALMSNCNNLCKLRVDFCKLVDHVAFFGLPDKVLKHLNFLSLSHCSLTDAAIPHIIRAAPMIQTFILNHCRITDAALAAISKLKKLYYLYVLCNAGITATGIEVLTGYCTDLRAIHDNGNSVLCSLCPWEAT